MLRHSSSSRSLHGYFPGANAVAEKISREQEPPENRCLISRTVKSKQNFKSDQRAFSPYIRQKYTFFCLPPQSTAEVFPKMNHRRDKLPSTLNSILLPGIVSLIYKRYTLALCMGKA